MSTQTITMIIHVLAQIGLIVFIFTVLFMLLWIMKLIATLDNTTMFLGERSEQQRKDIKKLLFKIRALLR